MDDKNRCPDNTALRAKLAAFLLGKVPHDTAKHVGRGAATPPATVYKWLNQEAFPSGFALIRLWRLFGVELLIEVFGETPEQLEALMARAQRRRALLADLAALERCGGDRVSGDRVSGDRMSS